MHYSVCINIDFQIKHFDRRTFATILEYNQ